jgi:hypothetical protein
MAKGQIRSTKESRKPKTSEKKKGPKYMMQGSLGQGSKPAVSDIGSKK